MERRNTPLDEHCANFLDFLERSLALFIFILETSREILVKDADKFNELVCPASLKMFKSEVFKV